MGLEQEKGKTMKTVILKPDSRCRIALGQFKDVLATVYKVYQQGNKIILEPIDDTPKETHWLMKPENKHLLKRLEDAIHEEETVDLGSFKKYL